jgi:hypothetical protein
MSDEPCSVCGSPYHRTDEMHPASSPPRDAWTYEYNDHDGGDPRYEIFSAGVLMAECWDEDVARRICGRTADDERANELALLRELEIAARGWQQSTQTTARQYRRQMLGILASLDKLRKEPDAG